MKRKRQNQPQSSKALLDIAILTAGKVDLFGRCVNAILSEMKPEYKIQVCNNGFPSSEYEGVYKLLPEGSTIKRSNVNTGYGGGANIAIKAGSAPLVLFVSDDVFLHDGTIEELIKTMDEPTVGLAGLKLLFPEDSTEISRPAGKVQHIGLASNIRGEIVHPLIGWSADNPKCNISRDVIAVTGAAFIVRRSIFNKVGGFDPVYGKGYFEDVDLCFKIRSLGLHVVVNADAVATHGVGQTFKDDKTLPPLQQNQNTFRSRWLNVMEWSEFTFW